MKTGINTNPGLKVNQNINFSGIKKTSLLVFCVVLDYSSSKLRTNNTNREPHQKKYKTQIKINANHIAQLIIHTTLKSALISTGSLVLLLNRTTATLSFVKGRDQTSKPFSLNYNTGRDLKLRIGHSSILRFQLNS